MASHDIADEFLSGVQEIFNLMLSQDIYLKPLDVEKTQTNVYNETLQKVSQEPIQLSGKVTLSDEQGTQNVEGVQNKATFKIPTKELMDKNVPFSTTKDIATLRKATISYQGIDYEVDDVIPMTNIQDVFQFYSFSCTKPKNRGG